ncbi:short-chain dehydrogenase, putative [Perkinsus marinus ATCC 50983]|uniref:Short-chain dehydrogenase, putative n=1 Tax=Perkinsus marinus (strain ATCC 50983 / TXsc) TaxID=423536 RepID=C5KQP2_PERM5|nr:short-chain dehydrogenase, putative [Perkinsus marinus ATCC 50983]EER13201.1 short-chain dehydrogenase, putative [Perkinsus marinus ATCC 50983]|eukprot:XP_002781406.1 short-chain dehydrogenase, putative [Perkinsus marinus ATCC 50983]
MSANNKIYYSQIDVTNEDEVKAGVKAVVDSGAKRVIVICNAGILNAGPTEDISHTNFMQTLDVNVASHQLLFSLFLHESISDANTLNLISFVSISSAMAFSASAFLSAYCASKAALLTLHQCMRLENRQQKQPVRFSVVCPFLVKDSPMFDGAFAYPTLPEKLVLFLCPPLECSYVAKAVINEAIINGKEVLCLPRWPLAFALLMSALLPTEIYDWITAISGGQVGMVGVMAKAEVHKGEVDKKDD